MSAQGEPLPVPVEEAVTHEVDGTPFSGGIRDGVHAGVRAELQGTRGRHPEATGTDQLAIERAVITARPS